MQIFENRKMEIVESNTYVQSFNVLIANADALEFLKTIPDQTVELVVSSVIPNLSKPIHSIDNYVLV